MNSRLICVVIAILPFHLAGVGEMLQHVCWHFGSERVPRKMELPIQHRNVGFTEYIADCARQLFINRLTLRSSSKELLSLFLFCEPFPSCLEPGARLLVSFVRSVKEWYSNWFSEWTNPHLFHVYSFLPASSLKCLDIGFQIREG